MRRPEIEPDGAHPEASRGIPAIVDANDHHAVVPAGDGGASSPSQPTVLVQAPGNVGALALDGCEGFGPAEDSGTVWRVAKRGGAPMLLAEGQIHPADIADDHDFVYWSSRGSRSKALADGSVERLAKLLATSALE